MDMPAYLYNFDVCLIPFLKNKVTEAVDPVKLYEYLSSGKPVVARDLYELRRYKELPVSLRQQGGICRLR
jgi:hypothetical protein